MKTIKNTSFDPFYNLALEEFLLKNNEITDDLFFLWRNKKCVVIGRNQNPFNEINIEYAKKHMATTINLFYSDKFLSFRVIFCIEFDKIYSTWNH